MKQHGTPLRIFAALLAFCLFTASFSPGLFANAEDSSYSDEYENMTNEEKQAYIEQKLKEINEKLDSLAEESEETEEYINTLDEKIKYLKNQLTVSEQEIEDSQEKIVTLEQQYEENEELIAQLEVEVEELNAKCETLEEQFNTSYALYCSRIRALYISGDTSILSMLLGCKDISSLLTRYEMIKRVSQSDKELLQTVKDESEELTQTKAETQDKQAQLTANQQTLVETKENLESTIEYLEQQQTDYQEKQSAYESEKEKSDTLLKELQDETQTYSEYRNQDQEELEAVNAEIAAAAEEFKKQLEAQTTTSATTTTKKQTTTASSSDESTTSSKTTTTTTTTTTKSSSSSSLSMTYPVPSQTTITCDYGSAGYSGHTGVDFSCATGSKVVAAESGYVFYTKQLTYSYGYYIVIMHDKKDSSGNYVYTLYAHNSSLQVSAGDYVTKGQLIAYSGSTGNSTGPHCHFEVRTPSAAYSDCVDPKLYLP